MKRALVWWNDHADRLIRHLPECDTCGRSDRWLSTFEELPTVLQDLGPCPGCWRGRRERAIDRIIRSGVTWGLVALLGFLVGFFLPWVMYRP